MFENKAHPAHLQRGFSLSLAKSYNSSPSSDILAWIDKDLISLSYSAWYLYVCPVLLDNKLCGKVMHVGRKIIYLVAVGQDKKNVLFFPAGAGTMNTLFPCLIFWILHRETKVCLPYILYPLYSIEFILLRVNSLIIG